jgi:hypothetical protein
MNNMSRKGLLVLAVLAAFAVVLGGSGPAAAAPRQAGVEPAATSDLTAQRRARIYVYPRRGGPGPNSVRQCRSWLAQEYRVSGTVIVPRMQCWWQ